MILYSPAINCEYDFVPYIMVNCIHFRYDVAPIIVALLQRYRTTNKFTNSTKSIENKKDLRSTDCYEIIPDMELETAIFGTKSYWKRAKLRQIYIYIYVRNYTGNKK